MSERAFIWKWTFFLSGMIVWAVHFGAIYAINSLACARGLAGATLWGIGFVPMAVGVATLVAVGATVAAMASAARRTAPGIAQEDVEELREFWRYTSMAIGALALVAILWDALPALIIPPCA